MRQWRHGSWWPSRNTQDGRWNRPMSSNSKASVISHVRLIVLWPMFVSPASLPARFSFLAFFLGVIELLGRGVIPRRSSAFIRQGETQAILKCKLLGVFEGLGFDQQRTLRSFLFFCSADNKSFSSFFIYLRFPLWQNTDVFYRLKIYISDVLTMLTWDNDR